MTEVEGRRQRAREAFWDHLMAPPVQINGTGGVADSLDRATETATRVQITPELVRTCYPSVLTERDVKLCTPHLIAAFRAAGFEVVE